MVKRFVRSSRHTDERLVHRPFRLAARVALQCASRGRRTNDPHRVHEVGQLLISGGRSGTRANLGTGVRLLRASRRGISDAAG